MPNNPELESVSRSQTEKTAATSDRPTKPWMINEMAAWEISDVLDWLDDNIPTWQQKGLPEFPWEASDAQQITSLADLKKNFAAESVSGEVLVAVVDDEYDQILKMVGIESEKSDSLIRNELRQHIMEHVAREQEKQSLLATGAKQDSNARVFQLPLIQKGVSHNLMFYQNQYDVTDVKNTKAYCVATKGLREQMEDAETVGCIHGFEALSERQKIAALEETCEFLNVSLAIHLDAAALAGSTFCASVLTKDRIYCANIGDTIPYLMVDNVLSPLIKEIRSLSNQRDRDILIKRLPKDGVDPGPWGHSYIYPDDVDNVSVTMRVGAPNQCRLNLFASMGDHAAFGIVGKMDKIKQMAKADTYVYEVGDMKTSGAVLMGCDGLTESVRQSQDLLKSSVVDVQTGIDSAPIKEPLELVRHLVTRAFKNGSRDNITALMLPFNAETLAQLNDKSIAMALFDGHGGPLISTFLSLCFVPILEIQVQRQRLLSEIEQLQSASDDVSVKDDSEYDEQPKLILLQSELKALNMRADQVIIQAKKQVMNVLQDLAVAESKATMTRLAAEYKSSHGASRSTLFSGQDRPSSEAKTEKSVENKLSAKTIAQSALDLGVVREKKDYEMETMKDDEIREQLKTINMLIVETKRGIAYAQELLLDPYQKHHIIEKYINENAELEAVLSDLIKQRERYKHQLEKRSDSKNPMPPASIYPLQERATLTDLKSVSTGLLSDDFIRKLTLLSRQFSLVAASYDAVDFEDHQTELLCRELGVDLTQLAKDGSFKAIDELTAAQLQAIVDEVREVREDREVRQRLR